MTDNAAQRDALRDRVLAEPDVILDDPDVMRALIAANERARGANVVDLRSVAMERLESRLDRLEETNRGVIAAAYENLSGTNQVHRAILRMLEASDFDEFLSDLCGEVADILRIDRAVLVLESDTGEAGPALSALGDVLKVRAQGFVDDHLTGGRNAPARVVTLRSVGDEDRALYGKRGTPIRSEACLRLDFGPGRLPGLLCLGSENPHQFAPAQGTDLLTFFAGTVERAMRRWLA